MNDNKPRIEATQVVALLMKELQFENTVKKGTSALPETISLANQFLKQEEAPDLVLIRKAATLASNLAGFPCEILHYPGKGYRVEPHLDLVKENMFVWHYLRGFSDWYNQAHQEIIGGNQVMVFTDLISAVFDFGGYWAPYRAMDIAEATRVQQICQRVNEAVAMQMIKGQG